MRRKFANAVNLAETDAETALIDEPWPITARGLSEHSYR